MPKAADRTYPYFICIGRQQKQKAPALSEQLRIEKVPRSDIAALLRHRGGCPSTEVKRPCELMLGEELANLRHGRPTANAQRRGDGLRKLEDERKKLLDGTLR